MNRMPSRERRAARLSLIFFCAAVVVRPARSEPVPSVTVASPQLHQELDQLTAQAKEKLSRFKPVWDAKRKQTVCGKLGEDGRPILGTNGKVLTGYNKITVEELLETKQGACAQLPSGSEGLRFQDLRGADLRYADLVNVWLTKTHLERARLEGADLRATDLPNAYLEGAFFDRHTRLPPQAMGMTDWPLKMVRVASRERP